MAGQQETHGGDNGDHEEAILQAACVVEIPICLRSQVRCIVRSGGARGRLERRVTAMLAALVPKQLLCHDARQRR